MVYVCKNKKKSGHGFMNVEKEWSWFHVRQKKRMVMV